MAGINGYVPLRRGLLEHLRYMGVTEVAVYCALLMMANPSTGQVSISQSDLAEIVGISKPSVCKSLRSLSVKTADRPAYIEYNPAANQWGNTTIKIIKYKRNMPVKNLDLRVNSSETAVKQQVNSTFGVTCGNIPPNSHESHESHERERRGVTDEQFQRLWDCWPIHRFPNRARTAMEAECEKGADPERIIAAALNTPKNGQALEWYIKDGTWRDFEPKSVEVCPLCRGSGFKLDDDGEVMLTDDGAAVQCECRRRE